LANSENLTGSEGEIGRSTIKNDQRGTVVPLNCRDASGSSQDTRVLDEVSSTPTCSTARVVETMAGTSVRTAEKSNGQPPSGVSPN
jgi:hypothetical protein